MRKHRGRYKKSGKIPTFFIHLNQNSIKLQRDTGMPKEVRDSQLIDRWCPLKNCKELEWHLPQLRLSPPLLQIHHLPNILILRIGFDICTLSTPNIVRVLLELKQCFSCECWLVLLHKNSLHTPRILLLESDLKVLDNCSFKLSTYLAAGLPVIVNSGTPARDIIEKKKLGIIADSLPEAIERVQTMTTTEYDQMVNSIDDFAKLIRGGYFVKRALTEAIFKAFYD